MDRGTPTEFLKEQETVQCNGYQGTQQETVICAVIIQRLDSSTLALFLRIA